MIDALRQLLEGIAEVLEAEREAIASLDLTSLASLTAEKTKLTQSVEAALVRPELRGDPTRRREVARAISSLRRKAAVNSILLQDAKSMLSRVRPETPARLTYDPRACNVRARAANDHGFVRTGVND
ncbi:MAG: flagellar protein FlgN [Nannocystaceae bacterium]|nr:flagellar protein FlgN [Nannocystaceae bacterium]